MKELVVSVEQVKAEHLSSGGLFKEIVEAADLYGVFEDLYGRDKFFRPCVQLKISFDFDDDYVGVIGKWVERALWAIAVAFDDDVDLKVGARNWLLLGCLLVGLLVSLGLGLLVRLELSLDLFFDGLLDLCLFYGFFYSLVDGFGFRFDRFDCLLDLFGLYFGLLFDWRFVVGH